uniref:Cilia and flagella associated protein 46 n=1 Tax=Anolis carolinensis TaxID=28377 RepID=G1KER8_ANOCA
MGFPEMSNDCLQMFFRGKPPVTQFFGRAYLCQSQLYTPVSTDNLEQFEKFIIHLLKAIDFALGDTRYYFLIYNASVIYWRNIRPFLKPGFRHFLIPSLTQIVLALKHPAEEDKDWTAELMIELLECFLDASRFEEAVDFSSTAAAFIKENVPGRYKQLFSIMVTLRKIIQTLCFYFYADTFRLCSPMSSMPAISPEASLANLWRLLSRSWMDQGKEIELDCLECDCEVKKLGPKIETYAKSVVEAQVKVIRKLELILNRAIRLRDPNVIQAVCATQWNICLPLLQPNLQHHVRKSLLAIAEILEKIDSMLILLRCQVHMEIARIEEKGDRIEAAMEHLQKAIDLDNNGQYNEYLKMAFHRLNLNTILYKSLDRLEDQASLMVEQAKKGTPKDSVRKKRSLLMNAGRALAPEAFQIVLDSENEAKVASSKSKGQISYLCARAEHHTRSVEKADGHLKRIGHENEKERIKLWSEIAKTARKQGVWDVCRAACRFCLLYDDCQTTKTPKRRKSKSSDLCAILQYQDLLRTLAEVRFINAEATIHLLRTEGVEFNDQPVLPVDINLHSSEQVSLQTGHEAEWSTYSSWISNLSKYAMENFLRAARIGEELNEAWIVHNTVVYILNHNKHLIAAKRQREIVESLQTLFSAVKNTGHCGNTTIFVTLCNALARALILPWIPKPIPKPDEKKVTEEGPVKRKKVSAKVHEKLVCEFAMHLPNGSVPDEPVPIAMRQQVIATWVKAKQLVQQQIGKWQGSEDEGNDEGSSPMAKLFIGLEMYSCNGLGLMDFSLPSLSNLVKMALECNWTDSLVQLQTMTRLAHFAYTIHDHELVTFCTQKALDLDDKALGNTEMKKKGIQQMLSIAACTQGKSMMENLGGKKHMRAVASKSFVESARFAGEAGDIDLAMIAGRHFWNACLPFIGSSADRQQLKLPTEVILKSIIKASESKHKQVMYCFL